MNKINKLNIRFNEINKIFNDKVHEISENIKILNEKEQQMNNFKRDFERIIQDMINYNTLLLDIIISNSNNDPIKFNNIYRSLKSHFITISKTIQNIDNISAINKQKINNYENININIMNENEKNEYIKSNYAIFKDIFSKYMTNISLNIANCMNLIVELNKIFKKLKITIKCISNIIDTNNVKYNLTQIQEIYESTLKTFKEIVKQCSNIKNNFIGSKKRINEKISEINKSVELINLIQNNNESKPKSITTMKKSKKSKRINASVITNENTSASVITNENTSASANTNINVNETEEKDFINLTQNDLQNMLPSFSNNIRNALGNFITVQREKRYKNLTQIFNINLLRQQYGNRNRNPPTNIPDEISMILSLYTAEPYNYQYSIEFNERTNSLFIKILHNGIQIIHLSLHANKIEYNNATIHIRNNRTQLHYNCVIKIKDGIIRLVSNDFNVFGNNSQNILNFFSDILNEIYVEQQQH